MLLFILLAVNIIVSKLDEYLSSLSAFYSFALIVYETHERSIVFV